MDVSLGAITEPHVQMHVVGTPGWMIASPQVDVRTGSCPMRNKIAATSCTPRLHRLFSTVRTVPRFKRS